LDYTAGVAAVVVLVVAVVVIVVVVTVVVCLAFRDSSSSPRCKSVVRSWDWSKNAGLGPAYSVACEAGWAGYHVAGVVGFVGGEAKQKHG